MYSERLTAGGGSKLVADTTTLTGQKIYAFIVQEDTVVNTATGGVEADLSSPPTNYVTQLGISGKTLKQGALFLVPQGEYIETFKLTSGSVIIYK